LVLGLRNTIRWEIRSVQPPVGEPENAKDQCCFPQGQQVEQRQSRALLSIAARLWGKRGPKISALYNRQMIESKKTKAYWRWQESRGSIKAAAWRYSDLQRDAWTNSSLWLK
jgi:hypothetical protein